MFDHMAEGSPEASWPVNAPPENRMATPLALPAGALHDHVRARPLRPQPPRLWGNHRRACHVYPSRHAPRGGSGGHRLWLPHGQRSPRRPLPLPRRPQLHAAPPHRQHHHRCIGHRLHHRGTGSAHLLRLASGPIPQRSFALYERPLPALTVNGGQRSPWRLPCKTALAQPNLELVDSGWSKPRAETQLGISPPTSGLG